MEDNIRQSKLSIASLALALFPLALTLGWVVFATLGYSFLGDLPVPTIVVTPIFAIILAVWSIRVIAKSSGMLVGRTRAWVAVLLATLQVACIILLCPRFIRSREEVNKARCRCHTSNLLPFYKGMWAAENSATIGQSITWEDLATLLEGKQVSCPSGGNYKLNPIGSNAECSIPEHKKCAQDIAKWSQSRYTETEAERTRKERSCCKIMKIVAVAKWRWINDNMVDNGQCVLWSDVKSYIGPRTGLMCPSGGIYTIGPVGEQTECSILGHSESWKQYLEDVPWNQIVDDEMKHTPRGKYPTREGSNKTIGERP